MDWKSFVREPDVRRPFKKLDKRLLRVVRMIQTEMGLNHIRGYYAATKKDDGEGFAEVSFSLTGWSFVMKFAPVFFKQPFTNQIDIIIHEFNHVVMVPYDALIWNTIHEYIPRKKQPPILNSIRDMVEVVVDCAVTGWRNQLWPKILEAAK